MGAERSACPDTSGPPYQLILLTFLSNSCSTLNGAVVIIILYVSVGFLAAAGSIFISQKLFSAKAERIFFGLFLIAIAGFYLAFTAYFGDQGAWRIETGEVIVFSLFGLLGLRLPAVFIIGYLLHGV